jgi:cold shock CspA family protein
MAKSQVTFNKIEKEKKRLKKREDKQKKKEARRSEAKENPQGIQFAYVDFNGNLTDTPPDPSMRVKIEAESIEIGIPKREMNEEEEPAAKEGKVSFFDTSKGFGFIIDSVNQEKYFVHVSGILQPIAENDKVTYELERGQKGMNAVRVKKI